MMTPYARSGFEILHKLHVEISIVAARINHRLKSQIVNSNSKHPLTIKPKKSTRLLLFI